MARLPRPGQDNGTWGDILNDYLSQSHEGNGTLKRDSVGATQLQDNAVTATTIAPGSINSVNVANGSITEALLDSATQTKLNMISSQEWEFISGKPLFDVTDSAYGAIHDGVTDDLAAIQSAVDACDSAGGGIVFIPKGIYVVSNSIRLDNSNVTLMGAGRSATILKTVSDYPVILAVSASNLVIRDLQVLGDSDSGKTNQRGVQFYIVDNSLIHNVLAKNLGYDGFCLLTGSVNNIVSNCLIEDCEDDGINIGGSQTMESIGNVVVGNVVVGSNNTGIHLSDGSSFTTVTGNNIVGCGDSGIDTYQSGVLIGVRGNNTIVGNVIRDCTDFGIHIKDTNENIVEGNTISGCQRSLRCTNTERTQFIGNNCTGASLSGILDDADCADLTVSNNLFHNCGSSGILIVGPRASINGNSVRGATAVSLQVASTGVDSVVNNNTITNGTTYAMNILATRCIVSGNLISGGTLAIYVSSAECVVSSNVIIGNSTIGIQIISTNCVVSGNIFDGQGSHGVRIDGADCLISGNTFKNVASNSVWVNAATRAHIVGNHFQSASIAINVTIGVDTFITNNATVSSSTYSLLENTASSGTIVVNNRFDGAVLTNGTNAIVRDISADYVNSGTSAKSSAYYQRSAWRQAKAILSSVSGASVTAIGLIPDGALLLGVTTRINTTLGTSSGVTGYTIGDGLDDDLWGTVESVTTGAASGSAGFTATGAAGVLYTSEQNVVVTATGGNFNGTGVIEVIAHYMICEAD